MRREWRIPAVAERAAFQEKQFSFAAHIRDPDNQPAPAGVEDRRLAIYRELFFNNLHKLIGNSFPVLRKIHGPARWRALVREFMVRHRAHTPYFLEIPREFLEFLEKEHASSPDDFPFLVELAHYEWMELALSVSTAADEAAAVDPAGDLLNGVPVKSALAWPLSYRFPVHRISEDFLPAEAGVQPTCLVIWRKPDFEIAFMELNPVTARLLERIGANDNAVTGGEILSDLAGEIAFDAAALALHGKAALEELRNSGVLLGTRINKEPTR